MKISSQPKAIVVGAGILGIAYAKTLAARGYHVDVFEKSEKAVGSSIRNFGMIWPIGQPAGTLYDRAIKSRSIWIELCKSAKIWHKKTGSFQVLSNPLEFELGKEFLERESNHREGLQLLDKSETLAALPIVNKSNTMGAIYSGTEIIVESREAIRVIPDYLTETQAIQFHFSTAVIEVMPNKIRTAMNKTYEAEIVVICNGYELNLLYPSFFKTSPITISQLQMLRSERITATIPALCAGLSFLHYKSYDKLPSLAIYEHWVKDNYPKHFFHGIHLLVSQNYQNQLTIGDSHDYGLHHDPFQIESVDELILDYLNDIFDIPDLKIAQRWTGQYLKLKNNSSEWIQEIENGVWVANGPGGAGMTLSFGMAEDTISQMIG
jgi:FAD dependent oxidoreductase TIGR03364